MTTFSPELTPQEFEKRQRIDCPYCNYSLSIEDNMQCQCGAVFEFQIKEVCEPEGNMYD